MKKYIGIGWLICAIFAMIFAFPVNATEVKNATEAAVGVVKAVGDEVADAAGDAVNNTAGAVVSTVDDIVSKLPQSTRDECAGWGAQAGLMMKGFADAVTGAASSTVDEVLKVSDTKVGKICTFVLVYKFIGKDIVDLCGNVLRTTCGIILLFIYIYMVCKFFKAFFYPIKQLTKTEGKVKTYEYKPSLAERIDENEPGISWLVLFMASIVIVGVGTIICSWI